MRLLVTRPLEDAITFAALLRADGHEAVIAPVMEVRFHEGPRIPLKGYQAILATSANGVRALARRTDKRDIPVYAVGPQTAEAARAAGFAEVRSAESDANALADRVAEWTRPEKGALLHAAGAETAGRLRQNLQARGFAVESPVLYDAVPAAALPAEAASALQTGGLDGVLLFSPRSAKTFATLVAEAKLEAACAPVTAYCISAATVSALGTLAFARVVVAGEPNQNAMLALLPKPAVVS